MKFIKENSYDIVKFFIYQIGIAVFSLTLAIPLEAAVDDKSSDLVQLLVSILAVAFYCILVYTVSWDHGATERIRIDAGKSSLDKFKGAKIAIVACLPNVILSLIAIVASLLYTEGNAWNAVLGLLLAILGLIESMYLGAIQFISSFITNESNVFLVRSICYLIFPFIIVAASHMGYVFGDKNFRIFGFIPGKNDKKTKK